MSAGTDVRSAAHPAADRVRGAGHQPQIQALRAVAVVSVIVYHFWPKALPGGYTGVDVFFVISGYLMTKTVLHIRRQHDDRFGATMREFYARRVTRILPASVLTLLVVTALVLTTLPLVDWSLNLRQVVASLLFLQNWYLASTSTDYLASGGSGAVQHFWSLSVEEQFYVVWPLLCVLAARASARVPRRLRAAPFLLVVGGLTAASFAYSVHETRANAAVAYFHTGTRFWELSFGGLVFLADRWLRSGRGAGLGAPARALGGWLGLGLVAYAAFAYDDATPFPSWYAALPVLGAGLAVLCSPDASRWSPARPLGLRPVQYVGDISYSLYLTHWPLLVLARAAVDHGAPLRAREKVALLVLTVVLSAAMKSPVEDRFRRTRALDARRHRARRRTVGTRRALWVLVTAQVVVLALAVLGLQLRSSAVATAKVRSVGFTQDAARRATCFAAISAGRTSSACPGPQGSVLTLVPSPLVASSDWPYRRCQVSGGTATPVRCDLLATGDRLMVVAGDSHITHWLPAILPWASRHGYRVTTFLKSGCPLTQASTWGRECLTWNVAVRAQVDALRPSVVVTGALSAFKASELHLKSTGLVAAWRHYARGATLVAFRDAPQPRVAGILNEPSCLVSHGREEPCRFQAADGLRFDIVAPAASQVPGARTVDVHDVLCRDGSCPPEIDGILTYIDYGHLSSYMAQGLADAVGRQLDAAVGG